MSWKVQQCFELRSNNLDKDNEDKGKKINKDKTKKKYKDQGEEEQEKYKKNLRNNLSRRLSGSTD